MIFFDQVVNIQPSKDIAIIFDDRLPPDVSQVIVANCKSEKLVIKFSQNDQSYLASINVRFGKTKMTSVGESAIIDQLKTLPIAGFRINSCFLPGTPLSVSIDVFTYEVGRYTRVPIWLLKKDGALVVQFTQPRTDIYPDEWPHPPRRSKLDRQSSRQP